MTDRAVLYLRQSTYREESISLHLQETACRDYCKKHGYAVVAVEADPGISGRTWQRPAVQRVMTMIENRDADVIVMWRWSRFSRNRMHWAVAEDRVDLAGGRIESATEPNDRTAAGRFGRGVMVELNAFESERIGEQWKEVHASRVKRGLPPGKTPWGWINTPGKTVEPDPINAPAIPIIYDLYINHGYGSWQIADWLTKHGYKTAYGKDKWADGTIPQLMDSPFHAGLIRYQGEIHEGAHEGLISRETWDKYVALRALRSKNRVKRDDTNYLLSGILTCKGCGHPMYGATIRPAKNRPQKNPYYGYRCDRPLQKIAGHKQRYAHMGWVDDAVTEWLTEYGALNQPLAQPDSDDGRDEADRIARERQKAETSLANLAVQLADGILTPTAYKLASEKIETRIDTLTQTLTSLEAQLTLRPEAPDTDATELLDTWDIIPTEARRQGIRGLVTKIVVDTEERTVTIHPRVGKTVTKNYHRRTNR